MYTAPLITLISSLLEHHFYADHGRRSVGGQGDMSPLLFEAPCVLPPPPTFLGADIVCNAQH